LAKDQRIMKRVFKLLAHVALAGFLIGGQAFAQAVLPSQGTQLPNPVVTGHAGVTLPAGASAPVLSACGTSTLSPGSSDVSGTVVITAGTPTSCTLTFATAWQAIPVCLWATSAGTNLTTVATTKTASVVTIAAGANATLGYVCIGAGL
jgi:hypothetical protein